MADNADVWFFGLRMIFRLNEGSCFETLWDCFFAMNKLLQLKSHCSVSVLLRTKINSISKETFIKEIAVLELVYICYLLQLFLVMKLRIIVNDFSIFIKYNCHLHLSHIMFGILVFLIEESNSQNCITSKFHLFYPLFFFSHNLARFLYWRKITDPLDGIMACY